MIACYTSHVSQQINLLFPPSTTRRYDMDFARHTQTHTNTDTHQHTNTQTQTHKHDTTTKHIHIVLHAAHTDTYKHRHTPTHKHRHTNMIPPLSTYTLCYMPPTRVHVHVYVTGPNEYVRTCHPHVVHEFDTHCSQHLYNV